MPAPPPPPPPLLLTKQIAKPPKSDKNGKAPPKFATMESELRSVLKVKSKSSSTGFKVKNWRGKPNTPQRAKEYKTLMDAIKVIKNQDILQAQKLYDHYERMIGILKGMNPTAESKRLFDEYFFENPATNRAGAIVAIEGNVDTYGETIQQVTKQIDALYAVLPKLENVDLLILPSDVNVPPDFLKPGILNRFNPIKRDPVQYRLLQDLLYYTDLVQSFVKKVLPNMNVKLTKEIGVGTSRSYSSTPRKPKRSLSSSSSVQSIVATNDRRGRIMVSNRHRPKLPMDLSSPKAKHIGTFIDTLIRHRDPTLPGCVPDGCITQPLRIGPSLSPYYVDANRRKVYCPRFRSKCIS